MLLMKKPFNNKEQVNSLKKPHIIYWKWNDEMLDIDAVRRKTLDITNRSIFDVIYVSLHPMSPENRILCGDKVCNLLKECADILRQHNRKLVLDLDIRCETAYLSQHPTLEKDYMVRCMQGVLDKNGALSVSVPEAEGIFLAKCMDFTEKGFFVESSVVDITDRVSVKNEVIYISAGEAFAGKTVIFFPIRKHLGYDICGDEYKSHRRLMFEKVKNIGISGAATDEWGFFTKVELEAEDNTRNTDEANNVHELKQSGFDLDTAPFVAKWFHISDGLLKYYNQAFDANLKDDLIWFRHSSPDTKKGELIVNRYLYILRSRIADGEASFYNTVKEFFGKDALVMCHPTYWGDELNSNLDNIKNGLDWWEVKRDFAQTDELILIPVRLAMSRKCPENLWYNMWYSMRTLDIKTYFKETWTNARYGGRTHYLGYECYEPGVVLTLKEEDRLEALSEMEEKIEKLNKVQSSRPDSRVLVIFGYEAVSNWKISEPNRLDWARGSKIFTGIWKLTKELFDNHFLCDAVPSYEIDNGNVTIDNNKICYCGHCYDAAVILYPVAASDKTKELLHSFANVHNTAIICDLRNEYVNLDAFKCNDIKSLCNWLSANGVNGNCGKNYCVFEDGSVTFTCDGENNIKNPLVIDENICGNHIKFNGTDFLYINSKTGDFACDEEAELTLNNIKIK